MVKPSEVDVHDPTGNLTIPSAITLLLPLFLAMPRVASSTKCIFVISKHQLPTPSTSQPRSLATSLATNHLPLKFML